MTKILKSITFLSLFMFSSLLSAQPYGYSTTRGSSGGGANVNLSNLSSVAINESLIPGIDNTIDLGSLSKRWRTVYAGTSYVLHNNSLDSLTINSPGVASFKISTDITVDLTIEGGQNLNLNSRSSSGITTISGGQNIINSDSDIQLNPALGSDVSIGLDGTALLPSLTFGTTDDPNTGLFHPSADVIAISTAGTERSRWSSNGDIIFAGGTGAERLFWDQANSILQLGGTSIGFANTGSAATMFQLGGITSVDEFGNISPLSIFGAPLNLSSDGSSHNVIVNNASYLSVETTTGLSIINSGSAGTPSFTIGSPLDANTGLFQPGADILAISNAGTETLRFTSDNALEVNASTAAVSALGKGRIRYLAASNALQVSNNGGAYTNIVNGTLVSGRVTLSTGTSSIGDDADLTFNGTVLAINQDGSASLPSLTMGTSADPNTGIFHPAADELATTVGGSERIRYRLSSAVNGTPRIAATIGTLTGDGEWGYYQTGTYLSGNTNNAYMFRVDGTGSGSGTGQQHIILGNHSGGYTGNKANAGVWGRNANVQSAPSAGDFNSMNGSFGVLGSSVGAGAGYGFGVAGNADTGSNVSTNILVGGYFRATTGFTTNTTIGVIGVGGSTGAGPTRIGGFFSNGYTNGSDGGTPTLSGVKGAVVADSVETGAAIFRGRNSATDRFMVMETGITNFMIDGTASAPVITLGSTADPNTGIFHPGADILAISTSGTEAIRIISTGEIGVGNAITPSSNVMIQATRTTNNGISIGLTNSQVGTAALSSFSAASDAGAIVMTAFSSGYTTTASTIASAGRIESSSGLSAGLVLSVGAASAPMLFYTNISGTRAERARLFSTGNWSFGGTTDLGQVTIDNGSTAESIFVLRDNGTTVAEMFDGGNISFGTTSDLAQLAIDNGSTAESILIARDNGTAVFSIIDGGDVGLGVTPTEKLSIKDHSAFSGSESQTTTGAVQTTDATQTNVIIITLNDTSVYWFEADVVGRRTDVVGDRVHYKFSGLCYREGGGAVIEAQTNMITQESGGATAFDAAFTASGNAIRVSVQGEAAKTVNWSTTLTYQRVSGNG